MDIGMTGKRIKEARERRNITQEELADMINMSATHISVIERGIKVPKLDTFVAIANALEISCDELLSDSIEHPKFIIPDEVSKAITNLSPKDRNKIIKMIKIYVEE